jgi:hypothetical protein
MNELDIQSHYINKNVVEITSRAMRCSFYVRPSEIGRTIAELTAEYLELSAVSDHRNKLAVRYMPNPYERRVSPQEAERIEQWARLHDRPFYRRWAQLGRRDFIVEMAAKDWELYDVQ